MKKFLCLLFIAALASGANAQNTIIDGVLRVTMPPGFAKADPNTKLTDIAKTFNNNSYVAMYAKENFGHLYRYKDVFVAITPEKTTFSRHEDVLEIKDERDAENKWDTTYHPVLKRVNKFLVFSYKRTTGNIEFYFFCYANDNNTRRVQGTMICKTTDDADGALILDDILKSSKFVD